MRTRYYIITHHDVDGRHCLDFILKLVKEAKVVFKERNKLSSYELSLFDSEQLGKQDFIFMVECMPTNQAIHKIVQLSKKAGHIFFFTHYVCLEKDHFDIIYRHAYCLFSGDFDYATETVVRNFFSTFRKAGLLGQDFSKSFRVLKKDLELLRKRNFVIKQQRCKKNPKRKFYIRCNPKDCDFDPYNDSMIEKTFPSWTHMKI